MDNLRLQMFQSELPMDGEELAELREIVKLDPNDKRREEWLERLSIAEHNGWSCHEEQSAPKTTEEPPQLSIQEGRWTRYVPGVSVLEFGRVVVAIGSRGGILLPSHAVEAYRPSWIFVLPYVPMAFLKAEHAAPAASAAGV